jgi:hypothetical protein
VKLAAARLRLRKLDLVAESLEETHHGFPRLGEQGVVEAGDEERDAH